jgi:hypothetical protein
VLREASSEFLTVPDIGGARRLPVVGSVIVVIGLAVLLLWTWPSTPPRTSSDVSTTSCGEVATARRWIGTSTRARTWRSRFYGSRVDVLRRDVERHVEAFDEVTSEIVELIVHDDRAAMW